MVARGQSASGATGRSRSARRRASASTRWRSTRACGSPSADGAPVGALIVGARPAHVHPIGARELYIELLISSRAHAGNDIGGQLVRRADALAAEAGVPVLRVDCWAGAPTLVGWYERQGFVRAGMFDYHGWMGQVFEKAIPAG
jgi:GNAT superfamily N-acetyltransferase